MHVHVISGDGAAKFWLEPEVELAGRQGFHPRHVTEIEAIVEDHYHELVSAWKRHFGH